MRIGARLIAVLVSVLAVGLSPRESAAQSSLSAAEAAAFLGAWTLGLETPQGAVALDLTLKDEGGKVVGALSAPILPAPQAITDISKEGKNLVLKYTMEAQGQTIPAKISLVPDGEKWKASFDLADGQMKLDGTATKK